MAQTDKTPVEEAQEVFDLVKGYAIQETKTPLAGVGQYLKFGVPGAVCLGLGFFFLALSALRCLLYTSPSPRDRTRSRMPSSA